MISSDMAANDLNGFLLIAQTHKVCMQVNDVMGLIPALNDLLTSVSGELAYCAELKEVKQNQTFVVAPTVIIISMDEAARP